MRYIDRWCPRCNRMVNSKYWKPRVNFFECLHCCCEIPKTLRDRFDDFVDNAENWVWRLRLRFWRR